MTEFTPPCYIYDSSNSFKWNIDNQDNCKGGFSTSIGSNVCTVFAFNDENSFSDVYSIEQKFIDGCLGSYEINIPTNKLIFEKTTPDLTASIVNDYNFVSSSFIVLGLFFVVGYLVAK